MRYARIVSFQIAGREAIDCAMENIRWAAIIILVLFFAYTTYVVWTESFWKSLKAILSRRWGIQICTDLVIGVTLFNVFVYLHEGSLLITLAWFAASLAFGNIATLFYLVLNFNALVAHFT